MLVVMQQGAAEAQIQAVIDRMVGEGYDVHRSTGVLHTVLGGVGGKVDVDLEIFERSRGSIAHCPYRPGGVWLIDERVPIEDLGAHYGRGIGEGECLAGNCGCCESGKQFSAIHVVFPLRVG